MLMNGKELYRFRNFELDVSERRLTRSGRPVRLPERSFHVLVVLVDRAGHLVTKSELLEIVWDGSFVEENNLNKAISQLRKCLGSRFGRERYIETVRGYGFRFVAAVERVEQGNGEMDPLPLSVDSAKTLSSESRHTRHSEDPHDLPELPPHVQSVHPATPGIHLERRRRFTLVRSKGFFFAAVIATAMIGLTGFRYWNTDEAKEFSGERSYRYVTNGLQVLNPAISPDGSFFAYDDVEGDRNRIWVQQIGHQNRTEIFSSSWGLGEKTFSPDGRLLYFLAHDNEINVTALYRLPVLGGTAVKVLEDIASPVSFSPSGSEFVFSRYYETEKTSRIIVASVEGDNERVLLERGDSITLFYPAWSPDGRSIAYQELRRHNELGDNFFEILRMDLPTGDISKLSTEPWATSYRLVWSAGGEGVVFVGTRQGDLFTTRRDQVWFADAKTGLSKRISVEGFRHELAGVSRDNAALVVPFNRASQVWVMDDFGDPRSAVRLTSGLADGRSGIAPLPDGRVGFMARNGDDWEVWVMDADGAAPRQITVEHPFGEELRASPDGKHLLLSARTDAGPRLYQIDIETGRSVPLTRTEHYAVDSSVSPDGKWIAYSSHWSAGSDSRAELFRIPFDGGEELKLTDEYASTPHYSPDGGFLSYICCGHAKIAVIAADGGPALKTFTPKSPAHLGSGARWTPDGKAVTYILVQNNHSNIWSQPLDGSPAVPLTNFSDGYIYNYEFSRDGKRLYLARGYQTNDAVLISNFLK